MSFFLTILLSLLSFEGTESRSSGRVTREIRRTIIVRAGSVAPLGLMTNVFLIAPSDPPSLAEGIRETQLTLSLERGAKKTQLQATVIGKDGPTLTILTAAHGLGPADVNASIQIRQGGKASTARVERVIRNPYFRPPPNSDIPGADNVIIRVRLDEGGTIELNALRVAVLAPWAIPDSDGQTVVIHTLDQFGKGHVVKAGNYSNPRWLEWGPTYRPIPGDSGSGVFIVRKKADGTTVPYLAGLVVDRSEQGGGASLIHLQDKWVFEATRPIKPGG